MPQRKKQHDGRFWIWLNAAAVTLSVLGVLGILVMLAWNGLGYFWPAKIAELEYQSGAEVELYIGEFKRKEYVDRELLRRHEDWQLPAGEKRFARRLLKTGNREILGRDFFWLLEHDMRTLRYPKELVVVERSEWGNAYGRVSAAHIGGEWLHAGPGGAFWETLESGLARVGKLRKEITAIEKKAVGSLNYRFEKLRLQERELELRNLAPEAHRQAQQRIRQEQQQLHARYALLGADLEKRRAQLEGDSLRLVLANGATLEIPFSQVLHVLRPNAMGVLRKSAVYGGRLWGFLSAEPREANTEGGVFPAIFGTLMMVLLMTVFVTPLGVIAAIYLHEYTRQGALTRMVRISVNNLAGVPSIVYGVFGLGFFVYVLGGNIDQLFYREALPAPTFGTPGLLWASLTLAILTLPVVIVTTEEGLARIPRNIREGGLALGATKAETLQNIILPMASPAIMTGLILAVARAAGEVAPLMLVGVVKMAPALPWDGHFPFLHLERKFMHLGFHIYDIGFQSPNVEAVRPLLFATAFLLVALIAALNLAAVMLRNRLREKYRSLEGSL